MTKTARQGAGQSGIKYRNRCGPAGPLPLMTHDEAQPGAVTKSAGGARLRFSRIPIARCAVRNPFRLVPLLRVSPGPSCYFPANSPGTRATRAESPQLCQPQTDFGPGVMSQGAGRSLLPWSNGREGPPRPLPHKQLNLSFTFRARGNTHRGQPSGDGRRSSGAGCPRLLRRALTRRSGR